jgi:methylenetetrahydrofolate--tRNA-(uracil-5-)-methyltransferase
MSDLEIIGGGLAGSEAAWQAAERGLRVKLYEMRPGKSTGAHCSANLAELVCSNSLGSAMIDRASGLLKEELRRLGSLLLECAMQTALPAGGALAVDREAFSQLVTSRIQAHPLIEVVRQEVKTIPSSPVIIASGPLTSPDLAAALQELTGHDHLFFFDAIAPIVRGETIDMEIAYRASRYGKGEQDEGDYINCPLDKDEYLRFVEALVNAERIPLRPFEQPIEKGVKAGTGNFFEGCLPIEVLAARGVNSLAFGPMRPVGLKDPRTQRRPYAVVQLRQDNLAGTLYNIVGFQTNLTYPEQSRVLRLIPGLAKADSFASAKCTAIHSSLHHLSFPQRFNRALVRTCSLPARSPALRDTWATLLRSRGRDKRCSIASGKEALVLPNETMLGGLLNYITHAQMENFQPMKANFGILPPIESPSMTKRERAMQYARRAMAHLETWADSLGITLLADHHDKEHP